MIEIESRAALEIIGTKIVQQTSKKPNVDLTSMVREWDLAALSSVIVNALEVDMQDHPDKPTAHVSLIFKDGVNLTVIVNRAEYALIQTILEDVKMIKNNGKLDVKSVTDRFMTKDEMDFVLVARARSNVNFTVVLFVIIASLLFLIRYVFFESLPALAQTLYPVVAFFAILMVVLKVNSSLRKLKDYVYSEDELTAYKNALSKSGN